MVEGLVMERPGKVTWTTIPSHETLQAHDVKLKVIYGGICGSDVGVFKGKLPHASYPVVPGHEILGEVIEKGSDTKIEMGQRVVVQPNTYCGACEACKKGKTNICSHKNSLGINVQGGFSQTFIVNEKYVIAVPDGLADERAVLIEPLAVAVHAVKKATITKGDSVAVIGCGTEGMLTVAIANYLGAEVTAIDINKEKLIEIKKHYPMIEIAHPDEVDADQFDTAVEVAGARRSFEQCIEIVKPGGKVIAVGFSEKAEIPVVKLVRKEITIMGSIIYKVPDDFLTAIDYLLDKTFYVEPIISEILDVDQFNEAYERAASGKYRKVLLNFKQK